MIGGEFLARLLRAQRTRRFKVIASVVVAALTIGAIVAFVVALHAPESSETVREAVGRAAEQRQSLEQAQEAARGFSQSGLRDALGGSDPAVAGSVAIAIVGLIALLIVWLGVAITYLLLGLLVAAVVAPMYAIEAVRGLAVVLGGAAALIGAFAALLQGVRALLSWRAPVFAVAQTVLAEAVRMRISIVFIVLLVFLLAALPVFLNEDQPLRYRVQTFLQWGTAGVYWVLLLLTLFFSIASVAFEQRDRIIWQTMTKPVRPWQYVVGKWLGVVALNATLLTAASTGVFLFTEYLRSQPANGEVRAYVPQRGEEAVTNDRRILESQVLVARIGREYTLEGVAPAEEVRRIATTQIEESLRRDPSLQAGPALQRTMERQVREQLLSQYRTIGPGESEAYTFTGLASAKREGLPLTVRFRVQAGTNNPADLYRVSFVFGRDEFVPRQAPLDVTQTFNIPSSLITDEGALRMEVINGDPFSPGLAPEERINQQSIFFEPGTLEVLYVAGGYEANFLRVAIVLWLKLCFIGAVGVACATFLSFPVACLVAFCVLLAAEASPFLNESLSDYTIETTQGRDYVALVVHIVARPLAWGFRWYGQMRPTQSLIDGRLVPWSQVLTAAGMLGLSTAVTLGIGWLIFRKRELATYSGH